MTEIGRIRDQLMRTFNGNAWHGPALHELLAGVTAEKANARPLPNGHTIWEIVLHITAWQDAVCLRINGRETELSPDQAWPTVKDAREPAWKKSLDALDHSLQNLDGTMATVADAQLGDIVPGRPHSVYFMLHGVIQHNVYHAGQIALLKKASQPR